MFGLCPSAGGRGHCEHAQRGAGEGEELAGCCLHRWIGVVGLFCDGFSFNGAMPARILLAGGGRTVNRDALADLVTLGPVTALVRMPEPVPRRSYRGRGIPDCISRRHAPSGPDDSLQTDLGMAGGGYRRPGADSRQTTEPGIKTTGTRSRIEARDGWRTGHRRRPHRAMSPARSVHRRFWNRIPNMIWRAEPISKKIGFICRFNLAKSLAGLIVSPQTNRPRGRPHTSHHSTDSHPSS